MTPNTHAWTGTVERLSTEAPALESTRHSKGMQRAIGNERKPADLRLEFILLREVEPGCKGPRLSEIEGLSASVFQMDPEHTLRSPQPPYHDAERISARRQAPQPS